MKYHFSTYISLYVMSIQKRKWCRDVFPNITHTVMVIFSGISHTYYHHYNQDVLLLEIIIMLVFSFQKWNSAKIKNLYTPGCMQLVNCKIGQFTMLMLWLLLQGLSVLPEKLIKGLSRTMVLPSFRQTWVPDGKQDMFAQFPEHRFRYPLCCVKTCQEGHSSMVEWVHSQCHQKSKK